jgi:UDP-glucuronate 4-epimerase
VTRPILVTGAAGFIGSHVCRQLSAQGRPVVALDNLEATYEPGLSARRRDELLQLPGVAYEAVDVADPAGLQWVFETHRPERVIHLAARAGVRGSHLDPMAYVRSNVVGWCAVLEQARRFEVEHVVYASSSSVYGDSAPVPFDVREPADHPISVYAATKRADELLAHSYGHAYGLPTTGLRFFTVYGPWGRPDMAYFAFADAILAGRPITVFGDGSALRDFTYVDDAVEAVLALAQRPPQGPGTDEDGGAEVPWRLYNVGHGGQVTVDELIRHLERRLGRTAQRIHEPAYTGDVRRTQADVTPLRRLLGDAPTTTLDDGLDQFVPWLLEFRQHHPVESLAGMGGS